MDIPSRMWSIDALQQYLMKCIAELRKRSMIERSARDTTKWTACAGYEEKIMKSIVDKTACVGFLESYAIK